MTKNIDIINLLNANGIKLIHAEGSQLNISTDCIFLIKSGSVNIFCNSIREDGSSGKKNFAAHFTETDVIFPVSDFNYRNEKIILTSDMIPGTEILQIDSAMAKLFSVNNEISRFFHKAFYNWIEKLSTPLSKDIIPETCKIISLEEIDRNNGIFSFESHTEFRPSHGITWVMVKEGFCVICGEEENVLMAEGSIFPLSHRLWMKTLEKSIVELKYASIVFQNDNFHKFTKAFYDSFFKIFLLSKLYRSESVKSKKQILSEMEKKALDASIDELASLSAQPDKINNSSRLISGDCFSVLEMVCIASKIKLRLPEKMADRKNTEECIIDILEHSSVYYRRVSLEKNWFKTEGRTILGFDKVSGNPIGLIYKKGAGYRIYRGESGILKKVSDNDINDIKNYAYEIFPKVKTGKIIFTDIIKLFFKGISSELCTVSFVSLSAGFVILSLPHFTEKIFNSIIPHAEIYQLTQAALILLTATLSYAFFKVCKSFIMLRIKTVSDYNFQHIIPIKLLRAPSSFYRTYSSGELAQRAGSADSLHELIAVNMLNAILAFFISFPAFIMMFFYSMEFALTGLFFSTLFIFMISVKCFLNSKNNDAEFHARGELSAFVIQIIAGINKIRLSVSENRVFVKWVAKFSMFAKAHAVNIRNKSSLTIMSSIYPAIMTGIFFYLAGDRWKGTFNIGEYLAFSSVFTLFTTGIMIFSAEIPSIFLLRSIYARIKPILETESESEEYLNMDIAQSGKVEIKHVSYRYSADAPLALNNINMIIKSGEHVVITGPSGAGKTSIVRIITGLDAPESGTVLYNGQDLSKLNKRELRKQLGIVLQNDTLISSSIFQNIAGASNISLEKALEAASLATLDQDMAKMPMGIHTFVSETNISGGQKQKILIARAIAKKPHIVILDEAMNAIDKENRIQVTENLRKSGTTLITVSHDMNHIKNADKVFFLRDGKNSLS